MSTVCDIIVAAVPEMFKVPVSTDCLSTLEAPASPEVFRTSQRSQLSFWFFCEMYRNY